jgi:competence ComEA-like helix-hairpin-helix protein
MLSSFTGDEKKIVGGVLGLVILGSVFASWNKPQPQPLFMDSYNAPGQTTATATARHTSDTLAARMSTLGNIDVNTANEEVLASVSGIGPSLAREIVKYREEHGPFHTVADLDAVKGIGPAKLAKMAPQVVAGASAGGASSGTLTSRTSGDNGGAGMPAQQQAQQQVRTMPGSPAQAIQSVQVQPVATSSQPSGASVLRAGARTAVATVTGIVNINTATEAELATLKRVGPVIAKRIVEYRLQHGAFASPAALQDVKGIGPKILEENLSRIAVR